ncbi:MAG TPA: GrpB family protein, partial [Actinomycetes bacterium]
GRPPLHDPVVVVDHDPRWAGTFEQERERIVGALGRLVLAVEHVGSTAVPGLAAKPIIDLLVGVRSLPEARTCCVEPLQALRYRYMAEYEAWLPGEMLFRKGPPGPWTHHAHLMEPTCPRWEEFTLVRDYLRRHPEVASAYADLKRALALVFEDDIAGYRTAKAPFIEAVIARARAER